MTSFILMGTYWIILVVESFGFHNIYARNIIKTKKVIPYTLTNKQEQCLIVLLSLRLLILVTQLVIGPLIDDFSIELTLAIVLGAELFGFGFGAIVTITSVRAIINSRKRKTASELNGVSIMTTHNILNDDTSRMSDIGFLAEWKWFLVVVFVVSLILGFLCYWSQGSFKKTVSVVTLVVAFGAVPLSGMVLWLSQKRRRDNNHRNDN